MSDFFTFCEFILFIRTTNERRLGRSVLSTQQSCDKWWIFHPGTSRLITSFKSLFVKCFLKEFRFREKALSVHLHVCFLITFHSCWAHYRKMSVCGPNYTRGRVIRSSPCWLSAPYGNRAIHGLTDVDDLSGREMCVGRGSGWVGVFQTS